MDIKQLRKQARLSRVELCKITGIPYNTLQNWENEKRVCPEYIKNFLKKIILKHILYAKLIYENQEITIYIHDPDKDKDVKYFSTPVRNNQINTKILTEIKKLQDKGYEIIIEEL